MSADTKKKKAPRRNRRRIAIFLGLGLLLLAFWVVGGYSINLPTSILLNQLNAKRELWDLQGIDSYWLGVVRGSTILWITVEDEQVTRLEQDTRDTAWWKTYTYEPDSVVPITSQVVPLSFGETIPVPYEMMTINNLFNLVELAWQDNKPLLSTCWNFENNFSLTYDIEFNEQYGFVRSIYRDRYPPWQIGLGMLCSRPTDTGEVFSISGFEPINIAD
jgi:hypothetical protein